MKILKELKDDGFNQTEYRYAGNSPKNYITFNNEPWRIIGLVNVMTDENTVSQRVKIVRSESIGNYSWDTSASSINNGGGINEWSESDLMKLLNPGYEENKLENSNGTTEESYVNNSLYWNGGSGTCYNGQKNVTTTCAFENKMQNKENFIAKNIIWNTGRNSDADINTIDTEGFYIYERSDNHDKLCSNTIYCNDQIERKATWKSENQKKAYVGLMYPSDYGYAIANNQKIQRDSCLNNSLNKWNNTNLMKECVENNWIFKGSEIWFMMPVETKQDGYACSFMNNYGSLVVYRADGAYNIFPVVYLNTNVKIAMGIGDSKDSFRLSLME